MTTLERPSLLLGDCLDVLRTMPDCSVDSIVTDPPYGLSFMGKKWDYDVPSVEVWAECLRVLKPGGHLLAFAGTRTQHRMAVRIEDAGFEIRDMIAWVYGSGFPKSLDVSKAIDKAAGVEREVVGKATCRRDDGSVYAVGHSGNITSNEPLTAAAAAWQGWGTALKPALEPITVARKPLVGTVAENVLSWGTGALNIDGCRVAGEPWKAHSATGLGSVKFFTAGETPVIDKAPHDAGRWPANLIHDGGDEVLGLFPNVKAGVAVRKNGNSGKGLFPVKIAIGSGNCGYGDFGSAARFFYCAKASKRDREGSTHPTMKPTDLMRYLCRLVTPPEGIVLDPFTGSGSTGKAAILEGFRFIGIERDEKYMKIAEARIAAAIESKKSC